jgi:CO dehydrogenase nickel-insertion accessory protein CooC1
LLGPLDETGQAVVADLEAGIGTLTRLDDEGVDAVCVVVEPTTK